LHIGVIKKPSAEAGPERLMQSEEEEEEARGSYMSPQWVAVLTHWISERERNSLMKSNLMCLTTELTTPVTFTIAAKFHKHPLGLGENL